MPGRVWQKVAVVRGWRSGLAIGIFAWAVAATGDGAAGQQARPTLMSELLDADRSAAVALAGARPAAVREMLDELRTTFDRSVHSARDVPEQRRVQYDAVSLERGLKIGAIYAEATGDRRPLELFAARERRIEGTVLLNRREYDAAVTALSDALEAAERLGDRWLRIITLTNLAYGHLEVGDGGAALARCRQALALAEGADPRSHALALFNLASVHLHLGQHAEAVPIAEAAARRAQDAGIRLWEGNAWLNVGAALRQMGEIDRARAALERARDVLLTTNDKLGIGRSAYNLALVASDLRDYRTATSEMERALPIIRETDIRHSHAIEPDPADYHNPFEETALRLLVRWHTELGDPETADAYARQLASVERTRPAGGSHRHGPHARPHR